MPHIMRTLAFTFFVFHTAPAFAESGVGREREAGCIHTATEFHCVEFVRNYDGDTITVNIPGVPPLFGESISVRVRGIDAAEIKGKSDCEKSAALIAKRLVEEALTTAHRIDLVNVGRDKYFRVLADVLVDGRSIGDALLKKELAYAYDGGTKSKIDWCKAAARTN